MDRVMTESAAPRVDYAHLPGEEQNPLMESTAHVDWAVTLLNSVRHVRAETDDLVTGNVAFAPDDGQPHTAPDLMVVPGCRGRDFGRYEPGPDDTLPSATLEIVSPSNTRAEIDGRSRRMLALGVGEVYVLDPRRDTVVRVREQDGELVHTSALGVPSEALGITFVNLDGALAVCCPAGRIVRRGDDPFAWLVEEMARADRAESRLDAAEQARADAERRTVELQAELARLRGDRT